jgi:hypothetical protein
VASGLLLVLWLVAPAARNHGIFEHGALRFGITYLFRESARFLSAVEPMLGIVD